MSNKPENGYEPAIWRFVNTGHQDGATNMAIDEAIMEAVEAGESPPTFRVYGWKPACLSLGLGQTWDVADYERCAERGWDVVRRATGGRAILHIDELTYSVNAPEGEPRVQGGIRESYRRLSEALVAGLEILGLRPQRTKPYYKDHGPLGPACFDGPSDYEITHGQMKLLGSAQARKRGMVLQHGTLPLDGDITRIVDGLYYELPGQRMAARSRLRYRATTLQQSLGRNVSFEEAAMAFKQGFAGHLHLSFSDEPLSAAEVERARQIRAEKYAHESWTRRV